LFPLDCFALDRDCEFCINQKAIGEFNKNMNKKPYIQTVSIDQLVNPWGDQERTDREVEQAMNNCSANPKPIKCKKCGDMYQPRPFELIYYDLCKTCFKEFDQQKMDGRTAYLEDMSKPFIHFEDANEWIKNAAK
jgi:methionyl-tRNA synthetase